MDEAELKARMLIYFSKTASQESLMNSVSSLVKSTKRFDATSARVFLLRRGIYKHGFKRYLYRPFDARWIYWDPDTKLLDEKRGDCEANSHDNLILTTTGRTRKERVEPPIFSRLLSDYNLMDSGARSFPLYLTGDVTTGGEKRPNLSARAAAYLDGLGAAPDDLFHHALATLHAPSYRTANAGALRQDWPRVPLPASAAALRASADLGRRVAALLDVETPVPGVTSGAIDPALRAIAAPAALDGRTLGALPDDFAVTVRWGYTGHTGQVMPGPGRTVARPLPAGVDPSLGGVRVDGTAGEALDVLWGDAAAWTGVPEAVWAYTLGSYPVLKKWLSYRSVAVLGRPLRLDEVQAFTSIARRVAALLLLAPDLDAAHRACVAEAGV